jgi:hypothetical protein
LSLVHYKSGLLFHWCSPPFRAGKARLPSSERGGARAPLTFRSTSLLPSLSLPSALSRTYNQRGPDAFSEDALIFMAVGSIIARVVGPEGPHDAMEALRLAVGIDGGRSDRPVVVGQLMTWGSATVTNRSRGPRCCSMSWLVLMASHIKRPHPSRMHPAA